MYYTNREEFNKKDNLINIKNKKHKIDNENYVDANIDTFDDTLNVLAPPSK